MTAAEQDLRRQLKEAHMSRAMLAARFAADVAEEVMKGRSILGLYPATDPQTQVDFAAWRKANKR